MADRFDSRLMRVAREQKVDLRINYTAAEIFNNLLKKVLTDELESAILRSESGDILNSPNYQAAHADLIGYRKGLRFALKLLENQGTKDD